MQHMANKRRFGRMMLSPVSKEHVLCRRNHKALFLCECGRTAYKRCCDVIRRKTSSCGCMTSTWLKSTGTHRATAGGEWASEYGPWSSARQRCYNKNNKKYPRYGARGIEMCNRWDRFENFLLDMGKRPVGTTLGRRDNDGDYAPGNCRWETAEQQSLNKSTSSFITRNGVTKNQIYWSKKLGLSSGLLCWRMKHWPESRWLDPVNRAHARPDRTSNETHEVS